MTVLDWVLSMEGRLGGMFRDFTLLIKDMRLEYNEEQSNSKCEMSQTFSAMWSVQRGESFKPCLYAWSVKKRVAHTESVKADNGGSW